LKERKIYLVLKKRILNVTLKALLIDKNGFSVMHQYIMIRIPFFNKAKTYQTIYSFSVKIRMHFTEFYGNFFYGSIEV
jgi:hypothetical protein